MVAIPIDVPVAPAAPAVESTGAGVGAPPWGETRLQQQLGQDYANWFHSAVHFVSGLFSSAGHAIDSAITQFLDDVVAPGMSALGTSIGFTVDQVNALYGITADLYGSVSAVINQLQYVAGQAGAVPGWVSSQLVELFGFAAWVRGPLRSFLQSQIDNVDYLATQALPAEIQSVRSEAAGWVSTALGQAVNYTNWLGSQIDRYAESLTGQAEAYTAAAVQGATTTAWDWVQGAEAKAAAEVGALAGTVPGIAEAIAKAVSGADVAPIAAALAAVIPAVATLTADAETCYNPMCDSLGGLSKLFAALKDDAWLALLVALLVEAATHPDQAVDALDAIAGDIEGIATGVADLLGVGR